MALSSGSPLHILSGLPTKTAGGRFNFPNRFRTTYLALDPITAQIEAERITAPYIHVPVVGDLQRVLRLDAPAVTAVLRLTPAELHADWRIPNAHGVETITQQLGHAAYESRRIEAITYPAFTYYATRCSRQCVEDLQPAVGRADTHARDQVHAAVNVGDHRYI
jgi:RES domain-containing protein